MLNYYYKPAIVPSYIIIIVIIIIKLTKIDVRHQHLLGILRKGQQTLAPAYRSSITPESSMRVTVYQCIKRKHSRIKIGDTATKTG